MSLFLLSSPLSFSLVGLPYAAYIRCSTVIVIVLDISCNPFTLSWGNCVTFQTFWADKLGRFKGFQERNFSDNNLVCITNTAASPYMVVNTICSRQRTIKDTLASKPARRPCKVFCLFLSSKKTLPLLNLSWVLSKGSPHQLTFLSLS